jgi:hypothetical protein
MYWNYRVVDHFEEYISHNPNISKPLDFEHLYSIHEVYYDENEKPAMWTEPIRLNDYEDLKDLKFTLNKMKLALSKPILKLVINSNGEEQLIE